MNCYTIENETFELTVSTLGAQAISFKSRGGFEYLWQDTGGYWQKHAPLLFPICGRLKESKYKYKGKIYEMNSHGFASKSEFELVSCEKCKITLVLSSNDATREIYPFDFRLLVTYELSGDELIFKATVINDSQETMPYMFGWHPGFALPTLCDSDISDYEIALEKPDSAVNLPLVNVGFVSDKTERLTLKFGRLTLDEDDLFNVGTYIIKNFGNSATLMAKKYDYELKMLMSDNLPVLCLWKAPDIRAKFICIEGWSSTPSDGDTDEDFETRIMPRLSQGERETYTFILKPNHRR